MPDWLFVLWAGGTALLSYSLVYALRKPFTAAEFEGLQVYGMDYKIAVSIIQLLGYVSAKLLGIKYISELRPEGRLKFIIGSAALSEISLIAFGVLPIPYNIVALYFNGLSLGCMWGVIFSFLEGRRTTDILASIMGVSMALSSGVAKSLGLYALNQLHVSEFWMPALIGAAAFPLLCFTGWMMTRFPRPTEADIASRSERVTLNGHQRWALFRRFMPLLILLFRSQPPAHRTTRHQGRLYRMHHRCTDHLFVGIRANRLDSDLCPAGCIRLARHNLQSPEGALHVIDTLYIRYGNLGVLRGDRRKRAYPHHHLALPSKPLPGHRLPELPDHLLRTLHRLLQDKGKRGVLHHYHRFCRLFRHTRLVALQGILRLSHRLGILLQPHEPVHRSGMLPFLHRLADLHDLCPEAQARPPARKGGTT